jgi:hypothetical protein
MKPQITIAYQAGKNYNIFETKPDAAASMYVYAMA